MTKVVAMSRVLEEKDQMVWFEDEIKHPVVALRSVRRTCLEAFLTFHLYLPTAVFYGAMFIEHCYSGNHILEVFALFVIILKRR